MANVQLSTLGAVIKAAYEGEANTNAFTDADVASLLYSVNQSIIYCTATGSNNVALTSGRSFGAYHTGMTVAWLSPAANTGAMTVNLDTLGAKDLTTIAGAALASGATNTGYLNLAVYDGTKFQIITVVLLNGANITDGSISLAKLANIADGTMLMRLPGAGAGVPTAQPITTAGYALLDDVDAAAQRTTLGAARSRTLIASGSVGTGTTAVIATSIPPGFSALLLAVENISHDNSGASRQLLCRFSTDNGSTYKSSAGDYRGHKLVWTNAPAQLTSQSIFEFGAQTHTGNTTGHALITGYSVLSNPRFESFLNDGTTMNNCFGQLAAGAVINALRLSWDNTGNFDGGSFSLYGIP